MDNGTAWAFIEMQKRHIEAMGMHWANETAKQKGETPPYNDGHFSNLAYAPL